jgi:glycosyltransferase involved in cell wall biosynthesis
VTVISPCFNEAESLGPFLKSLRSTLETLGVSYEVIVVDDGSTDSSWSVLSATNWPELRALRLVANRGHQVALDAGLREAAGDFVVTMDSDGQHPPGLIPVLLATAKRTHADVVYAVRQDRSEDPWFKRSTASAYYRLMRSMSGVAIQDSAADYRLMTRFVVNVINQIPDQKVFRLLLPYLGFSSTTVEFQALRREHGESKYSLGRMASLAMRSCIQFSTRPLRIVMGAGFLMSFLAALWLIWVLVDFFSGRTVAGWASQMSVTLIVGGLTLFGLGIVGEYVGEVFERVKGQPNYVIKDALGGRASLGDSGDCQNN